MIELIDPIIKSYKIHISTGLNVHYLEASKNRKSIIKKPTTIYCQGTETVDFFRKVSTRCPAQGFDQAEREPARLRYRGRPR